MRLLVIADIHANYEALKAVESAAGSVDATLFLGGAALFGASVSECVNWLRNSATWAVAGEDDLAVALSRVGPAADEPTAWRDATSALHRNQLDADDLTWLAGLAPRLSFYFDMRSMLAVHRVGTPAVAADPDARLSALRELTASSGADCLFTAGDRAPWVLEEQGFTAASPGSVGLPGDGDPRASFLIWEGGTLQIHRVEYDVEKAVRDVLLMPLPLEVAKQIKHRLLTGHAYRQGETG
ncbi:MAG: metallophosphoesterase family protein [Armatimonadetes bacterium]|nr:metallophosphoesterase family protein [Armatimonadota bacterium]MDE2205364.1 metallophosphoesterase family protein [Armatimonadota bacterium]